MHSIFGCTYLCIHKYFNVVMHGDNQTMALLWCKGNPGCFRRNLPFVCIVAFVVFHFLLDEPPWGLDQVTYRAQCSH